MKTHEISKKKTNSGFTLIEVLIVIGIIAILAAIVIIAINPARHFAQARDTQRTSNVNTIPNAIGQRLADNKGIFEGQFTANGDTFICGKLPIASTTITWDGATNTTTPTGKLGCLIPTYIPAGLNDPKPNTSLTNADYEVAFTNGRVTVDAPSAEINTPISVTR